jgi:surface glycoprotein (TIGR04207 family)
MTGTSNQIRAILLVAIMLLSGVAVGTGLTGSVAAQQAQPAADSTEAPEYNLEFNGGDIYAFGSPGPTDQTLTGV